MWYGFKLPGSEKVGWVNSSDQNLKNNWEQFFEIVKDVAPNGYCDCKTLIGKIEAASGGSKDNKLTAEEIKEAIGKPDIAAQLRRLIVNDRTEWSAFTDESMSKWSRFYKHYHPNVVKAEWIDFLKQFQWWDSVQPVLDPLLKPTNLWFFHPIAFLEHLKRFSTQQINIEMLKAAGAVGNDAELDDLLQILNQSADLYEINTPLRIAHFLAQAGHESGFKVIHEKLNYSKEQMQATFTTKKSDGTYKYHKLWDEPDSYAHKPKEIASYVYANRMGNGDEASGDGYKYRGRGLIQLTGRNNYIAFTKNLNTRFPNDKKDFEKDPDLLVNESKYGIESAFSWWIENDVNSLCGGKTDKDVENVTQRVNGGQKGFDDRLKRFKAIILRMGL